MLGVLLDKEIERIDHRHIGGHIDNDLEFLRRLGEYQPRDPVAIRILLPV